MKKFKSTTLLFISLLPFAAFADDEMSRPLPDDSYIHAKIKQQLWPMYQAKWCSNHLKCKAVWTKNMPNIRTAFNRPLPKIISRPDSVKKDRQMDEIAAWWENTDKYC